MREEGAPDGGGWGPAGWGPPGRPPANLKWRTGEIVGSGRTLEHVLGSRTRGRLFAVLLLEPGRTLWLREICREVRAGASNTQRELAWLVDVGLVRMEKRGRMHFYRVNHAHPLYEPLRELVVAAAEVDGSPAGRWQEPPKDFPLRYG